MSTDNLDMRFNEAQSLVQTLPKRPDTNTLLQLYALYKQGTAGDVEGKRPGMMDLKGRAKYDAWEGEKGKSQEAAKQAYVDLVNGLLKG